MKIIFSPKVFLELVVIEDIVGNREFSGYGFINIEKRAGETVFYVYDIELLDVGSTGFTAFDSKSILKVMQRNDTNHMKLWFHRHPLGDGRPGKHNWSGTDETTCTREPLGCIDPNTVKWALAAVLTPKGWVGRVDQFNNGEVKTTHIPTQVDIPNDVANKALKLLENQVETEKKGTPKYEGLLIKGKDDDYDTGVAAIDEAFFILEIAEQQIENGNFNEAADSIDWSYGVGYFYKKTPRISLRAKSLLKDAKKMKEKLKKVRVTA